jgi:hypothetical protein
MRESRDAGVVSMLLLCAVLVLAGCGNSRTPVPRLERPGSTSGVQTLRYPAAGVILRAPRDWSAVAGQLPLVVSITSGTAVVALWRFPRNVGPPSGAAALRRARTLLIREARARDPGMALIRSTITTLDGAPAIELDAFEQIAGHQRRVRSAHVFERRAEIVLDEYAPPQMFHSVDHTVFSPLKRSLMLPGASTA